MQKHARSKCVKHFSTLTSREATLLAGEGLTLEVRTREGTLFLFPGTIRGFNPQPDPPRELLLGSSQ